MVLMLGVQHKHKQTCRDRDSGIWARDLPVAPCDSMKLPNRTNNMDHSLIFKPYLTSGGNM